jgi:hypothetical protein
MTWSLIMKKAIASLMLLCALTGCVDSAEKEASTLISEAKDIYDTRYRGEPGKISGTFVLDKAYVAKCIDQMQSAQAKLNKVNTEYSTTEIAHNPWTQKLSGLVSSQISSCKQIKTQQGW